MKKISSILLFCCLFLSGCSSITSSKEVQEPKVIEKIKTVVVPAVSLEEQVKKTHKLGIIGEVEPVYFPPLKKSVLARIDTGAENSSLDAQNIELFEREGDKWVSFDFHDKRTGQKHRFEKRLYKQVKIKRQEISEERLVVLMTVKIGSERISAQFSFADREKFKYPVLIGRNILKGRAIVDTALYKTLH